MSKDPPPKPAILVREVLQELTPKPFVLNVDVEHIKWSAQSETSDERLYRLRQTEVEIISRLKREEAEAHHKLNEERDEAQARRRNQLIGFCFVIAMITALFGLCMWIVFSKDYPADTEKWATAGLMSILTGVISSILGYAIGKATAK